MRLVQFSGGTDIHPGVLVGYDYIIDLKVPAKASLGKLVSPTQLPFTFLTKVFRSMVRTAFIVASP